MKVVINPEYNKLSSFVKNLPHSFDTAGKSLYTGRNTVRRFFEDGEDLVVKHFKRPNIIQSFVYSFFRPSKARRAYEYALRLKQLGIDTPSPVGYIDIKGFGLYRDGYFVSLCYDFESSAFLRKVGEDEIMSGRHDELLRAIAAEIGRSHDCGFLHGDLNLSNILFKKENGQYRITFIDINRSKFKDSLSLDEKADSLMRLTHERYLLRRLLSFYNEARKEDSRVSAEMVEKKLDNFVRRKRLVYAIKGKHWSPA